MHDVEAEWLIIGETLLPVLQKATFPNLPGRVVIVGEVPPGFKAESYQRVLEEGGQETPPLNAELDDDVAICYTSGTTGCPKGVVYRHRNALASGRWVARITKMQFSDVLLTAIPMYISSNFNGHFLASLMRGVPLVLLKRFDPKNVLTKLKAHKVTIFHGTGNMYTELFKYKNFSAYDLPSLRMLTWSNILPAALLTRMRVDFPGVEIMQFYGFAEGGPVGTCINLQELFQRPGSCGRIEPEMANFRVVDEMENDVPTGEIGEIIYQGPGLMRAYYRNPQMTAKAIRNGWYYTGDLGKIDQDGFLYVVGRNKDIIYCDGKRVYPAEVEEVLFKHPSVLDVAVVGVPRATSGEEVKAFVVLKEGDYATEEDMIVYCQKANLAPYKIPAKVEFRKTFPKSSMGKTLKNELL
jgi:long-chain acyl-CoA synthetase